MKKITIENLERRIYNKKERKENKLTCRLINNISNTGASLVVKKKKKKIRCQNWDDVEDKKKYNRPCVLRVRKRRDCDTVM